MRTLSLASPREIELRTVPTGRPRALAISLELSPAQ